MSVYAIGDIHGCALTFTQLVYVELKVKAGDKLFLLGDLIDRGPSSKGVLDEVLALRNQGVEVHILRGNHEQLLLEGLENEVAFNRWLKAGGDSFLSSFDANGFEDVPSAYLDILKETELISFYKEFILVHAGLDFSLGDPFKNKDAYLWIRSMQPDLNWLAERKIVHGHTPQTLEEIKAQNGSALNLDGGCVFPEREGMGWLVSLDLDSLTLNYSSYKD